VLDSVRRRADEAGVAVVTGDTKVAPKGLADGMYINTAGVGVFPDGLRLDADTAGAGDALVVSGPVGRHGTAVLLARGDLRLETPVESDVAPLHLAARAALDAGGVRWMRDLTRGGLAMALADLADAAGLTAVVEEERLPADDAVQAACDLLGLDPLTVACEGAFVLAVATDQADAVCAALRGAGGCPRAAVAGALQARDRHGVEILTRIGSRRVVPAPRGEQLPRIC
jgi:hydrogenase expression/formation protein HypE